MAISGCRSLLLGSTLMTVCYAGNTAEAGEVGLVRKLDKAPLYMVDAKGRQYVTVPMDIAAQCIDAWNTWQGTNNDFNTLFRTTPREKREIRKALMKAWFAMDACEECFDITEKDGTVTAVLKPGAGPLVRKHELEVYVVSISGN